MYPPTILGQTAALGGLAPPTIMGQAVAQPWGFARSSGHIIQANGLGSGILGGGTAAKATRIIGSGPSGLKRALLPGEHIFPMAHAYEAVHNYRRLNGLPPSRRWDDTTLPVSHVVHIMGMAHDAMNRKDGEHLRGGFLQGLLPLVSGAVMPFLGTALRTLGMGALGQLGSTLANKITGSGVAHHGLPVLYRHDDGHHYVHLHGEGFRDWIGAAWRKAKSLFTSEPVRKLGAHAVTTLKDALLNALVERLDNAGNKLASRIGGYDIQPTMSVREEKRRAAEREAAGLTAPSYEEITRVHPQAETPNYIDDMAPRGSGMVRRRRMTTPRGRGNVPMKRRNPARGMGTAKRSRPYSDDIY